MTTNTTPTTFLDKYLKVTADPVQPTSEETVKKHKAVFEKIADIKNQIEELTKELTKQLGLLSDKPKPKPKINLRELCKTTTDWSKLLNAVQGYDFGGLDIGDVICCMCMEVGNKTIINHIMHDIALSGQKTVHSMNMLCVGAYKYCPQMMSWVLSTMPETTCTTEYINQLLTVYKEHATKNNNGLVIHTKVYGELARKFTNVADTIIHRMVMDSKAGMSDCNFSDEDLYKISAKAAEQKNLDWMQWASGMILMNKID